MKKVAVHTPSADYDVLIGPGLLKDLGEKVRSKISAKRCVLVSGENVFPIYGELALQSLKKAELEAEFIVFPSGENTKSLARYEELLNYLTAKKLTRSDCLVALGGGVTGDLTGFAAATYQRGISYIQVPTTLLAAVDSSVGGKTAVNLPAAKNQVGAFYQPALVLCDTDTLDTLPEREMCSGYAEVIKYAVLGDADLFDSLQQRNCSLEDVIEICVRMKADIVEEDERDLGRRRLLNLGHTFGHAVESNSNYKLLHGEAVAIGMAMIANAAVKKGYLDPESRDTIIELLNDYKLPKESVFKAEKLYETLLLDKKISSGKLHLVVPRAIGWCETVAVSPEELKTWLEAGYE